MAATKVELISIFQEFFIALGAGAGTWLGPTDVFPEGIWITPEGERFVG